MKKRMLPTLLLWLMLLHLCSATALADAAGVLTETEINGWLSKLLMSTVDVNPINAPVGEESYTEDGYAFIYETATLYYDKPTLDAQSKLLSIAVTSASLEMPRNIRLGAPADMLLTSYGWQMESLTGTDSFTPLYVLDQLPQAAYWAWAQHTGGTLTGVQCAIHAHMGGGRYTDAGILYSVLDDEISAIRIYGISAVTTYAAVQGNLAAVGGGRAQPAGITQQSDAEPFSQQDLQFNRMDFVTLTEKGAAVLLGTPVAQDYAQEEDGGWLLTLTYEGAALVFQMDNQKQHAQLESLVVTAEGFTGPRGLTIGMPLETALSLFRMEGSGYVSETAALLYGDGQTPPFGTLEQEDGFAIARYQTLAQDAAGTQTVFALHLSFTNGSLTELMLYRN